MTRASVRMKISEYPPPPPLGIIKKEMTDPVQRIKSTDPLIFAMAEILSLTSLHGESHQ